MKYKYGIVLTGGIGTGKSSVASFLKMFGYKIIDADEISKEVFNQNLNKIKEIFHTTDRKKIREIVFRDKNKLEKLENIILPEVKKRVLELANKYEKDKVYYFIELPLYFEKQNYPEFDKVVVVYSPKDLQIERVIKRDKVSKESVLDILNNQLDIEIKKQKADFVIDNSKDIKHLQKEIERFISQLNQN